MKESYTRIHKLSSNSGSYVGTAGDKKAEIYMTRWTHVKPPYVGATGPPEGLGRFVGGFPCMAGRASDYNWLVVCAKSLQLCATLYGAVDCSLPGCSVHGILQARIRKWVVTSHPGDHPDPGIEPASLLSPALADRYVTTSTTWQASVRFASYVSS